MSYEKADPARFRRGSALFLWGYLTAPFGGDKRDRTADLLNAMGSIVNINEYFWLKQSNMSNYIA